jgi:hypothetical protein
VADQPDARAALVTLKIDLRILGTDDPQRVAAVADRLQQGVALEVLERLLAEPRRGRPRERDAFLTASLTAWYILLKDAVEPIALAARSGDRKAVTQVARTWVEEVRRVEPDPGDQLPALLHGMKVVAEHLEATLADLSLQEVRSASKLAYAVLASAKKTTAASIEATVKEHWRANRRRQTRQRVEKSA